MSDTVWRIHDVPSWQGSVRPILKEIADDFGYPKPNWWLDRGADIGERQAAWHSKDVRANFFSQVAEAFVERTPFRSVQAFHATKVGDPSNILSAGLRVATEEVLRSMAREWFVAERFPDLGLDQLDRALTVISESRVGNIYFYLHPRVARASHFVHRGCEYLDEVACRLGGNFKSRSQDLREKWTGQAGIVVCSVPFELCASPYLDGLMACAASLLAGSDYDLSGTTLSITEPLAAAHIERFESL